MKEKILLIEDEEYLSDMYKMKFEHEGYKVVAAPNGEKGLELARSEKPDLVFLDIVLPGMNGYEVMHALREDPVTKGLKVYFLSNMGQDEEIARGMSEGADGFILKTDVTPGELVALARRILAGEKVDTLRKKPLMSVVA